VKVLALGSELAEGEGRSKRGAEQAAAAAALAGLTALTAPASDSPTSSQEGLEEGA